MDVLKDLFYSNQEVLKNTLKSLKKNWMIIFTGFFYMTATLLLYSIIPLFGLLAGIVMIIATSALISNYLYLLNCIIRRDRITIQDFKDGFTIYLRKVWGILFVSYVANLAYSLLAMPFLSRLIGSFAAQWAFTFLILVFFNPLPEVVYQKYYQPWDSITYTFENVRENWLEWFLPNIILLGVLYLLTGQQLTGIFNYYILPTRGLFSPLGIILYLLGQLWFAFMMIYRGYLFDLLSTSNRRKRLFMRRF
ncbi:hypothetical protein [Alkaliphilus crotonatoxidans]